MFCRPILRRQVEQQENASPFGHRRHPDIFPDLPSFSFRPLHGDVLLISSDYASRQRVRFDRNGDAWCSDERSFITRQGHVDAPSVNIAFALALRQRRSSMLEKD